MTANHLLNVTDHGSRGLRRVLDLSVDVSPIDARPLDGKGVALIFEKPSNRTRHSMEMAVVQLGGHPVYTRGEEVGIDTRESVEDITRIMSGYHAILAARVFSHRVLDRMAAVSGIPVVNMLSDFSHPLQAVADVLTMEERIGRLHGRKVAWVGDFNNVARSLGEAVCLEGGSISFGCPSGYGPSPDEIGRLSALGGSATFSVDPYEAVDGAHVVHTDTWISMGQEAESEGRREVFAPYSVNTKLMGAARPDAWFMHCMPAHRGEEVTAEVFDGSQSLVIRQGHHRLSAARGVLAYLIETSTGGQA